MVKKTQTVEVEEKINLELGQEPVNEIEEEPVLKKFSNQFDINLMIEVVNTLVAKHEVEKAHILVDMLSKIETEFDYSYFKRD